MHAITVGPNCGKLQSVTYQLSYFGGYDIDQAPTQLGAALPTR